jgi:signal transduction histidine kinase
LQAKEDAERASDAKSEFLATLSHELRTPLTPVLLTVSLMERHPGLPADLRADVATIRRNVELESRLISDLLDLTRSPRASSTSTCRTSTCTAGPLGDRHLPARRLGEPDG